jgi:hypothetical protein
MQGPAANLRTEMAVAGAQTRAVVLLLGGGGFVAELGGQGLDLATGFFEGAGAIDLRRGMAELFGDGELRGDALASVFVAEAAGAKALELLLGAAPGDYEAIEILVIAGFDEQRGFDEGGLASAIACPFRKFLVNGDFDARVKDRVEASEFGRVGEDNGGEFCAIYASVVGEDRGAEFANDFVVSGLAGLDEFVGEGIGVEDVEAQFAKHGGDGGFSCGDASG